MNTILKTDDFECWLTNLADLKAKAKILVRIDRASVGNFGDVAPVGDGVFELRIDFGPGYRIYYAREGRVVYLLLTGGDKSTQNADIARAKRMWSEIREK